MACVRARILECGIGRLLFRAAETIRLAWGLHKRRRKRMRDLRELWLLDDTSLRDIGVPVSKFARWPDQAPI
jgi:uncharacterized protein YjiS (DUF1127 family)